MTTHFTLMACAFALLLALCACGGRTDDASRTTAAEVGPPTSKAAAEATSVAAESSATSPAPAEDTVTRLSREVAQLHREVSDLRQQFARGGVTTAAAPSGPDPRANPEARAEAAQAERLRVASTEQAFRNQQVDARWSQGATASVRAALGEVDEELRSQVRSVECRGQSCRVEISSDGPAVARDLPILVNRLGQTLPNVTAGQVDQGDGRQATVLYLSR